MTQGTVYKSVLKNAAYIFFIKLFPAISSISVIILYSRRLSETDYGNYQDLWIKLLLLGTVAYAGLPVTVITYAAGVIKHIAGRLDSKHYFLYACWLALWAVVFAAFTASGLELPAVLSIGLLVLYAVHAIQEALLMAARRMNGLLVFNFLYALYFLVVHVSVLPDYDLEKLLWYLLAGMVLRAVFLSFILFVSYAKVSVTGLPSEGLRKARGLWLHLGFYDLMQNTFRFIDKFILSVFLSAGLYAVYFNGSQTAEVPLLPYLLGAVASSVLIQLSDKNAKGQQSHELMLMSGRLLSCVVFPLFFFLFFFSREIFVVVLTEKYLPSVSIFMMAVLVLPLRACNYTMLLQHLQQGALINKGALLDLFLALGLMYPLYRLLGLPGIALSFVVSTYIQVAYYLFHTSRLTGAPLQKLLPLKNWGVKLLVFGPVFFLVHLLLENNFDIRTSLVAGALTVPLVILISLRLEFRKKGRQDVISR